MANMRLISVNNWDAATLTQSAGDYEHRLPITHTQIYNNSRVFRSSSTADIEILFNWGEPVFLEAFTLWRHNLTSEAQIRVQLYNGPHQTGDLIFDSGNILADIPKNLGDLVWGKDPLGVSTYTHWETATRAIWFEETFVTVSGRLTVSNPSNPNGFLEVGRIYAGETFSPTINADLDHVFQWETDVKSNPTAGGTVHTLDAALYRRLTFNLSHLSFGDRAEFANLTRALSTHKDFFLALRPGVGGAFERDYSFAAKFEQIPSLKAQALRYETQCNIREV